MITDFTWWADQWVIRDTTGKPAAWVKHTGDQYQLLVEGGSLRAAYPTLTQAQNAGYLYLRRCIEIEGDAA
jgi:hypothetical protein